MLQKVTDFHQDQARIAELSAFKQRVDLALASKDLYEYVKYTNRGYIPNRFGESVCHSVQEFLLDDTFKGAFQILIIVSPPQHGKSTNVTGSAPSWILGQRPDSHIMILSYGDDLALKFGSMNLAKTREYGERMFGIKLDESRKVPCTNVNFSIANMNGTVNSFGLTSGVTGNPANCFPKGTMISTEIGDIEISELWKTAYPPLILTHNHETGLNEYQSVVATRKKSGNLFSTITTQSGVRCESTSDHRFWCESSKEYKEACDLHCCDSLLTLNGEDVVRDILTIRGERDVYDIQTANNHNFFANGILVHNCIFIDDPIKSVAEADSEVQRNAVWSGWQANVKSRLAAKAKIIVILCLTGDTLVLMSDGSEKELKNIRIGDSVATYKDGKLDVSTVKNWKCQGSDIVFTIRMESGTIIKGNERHPFLVERDGYTEWTRIKDLKVGDKVIRARDIGENGEESNAPWKTATNPQDVKDIANPITTNSNGRPDIAAHRLIQNPEEPHDFNTDMELVEKNMNPCLLRKAGDVPYAENFQAKTCERIGEENSASITTIPREKFERSYATTATLLSDMGKQKESCFLPLNTFEITYDRVLDITESGYEDVYDIQIESTENFIANGLVSHNTRWHEDDLAGRIQAYENICENVKVLEYACECEDEENDPLHRKHGEPLSPELGKDREWLEHMKASYLSDPSMGGQRTWDSLYQGRPNIIGGNIVEVAWFRFWKPKGMSLPKVRLMTSNNETVEIEAEEVPDFWDTEIQSWDFAFKDKKTSDFVCGGYLSRRKSCIYLLDAFHEVASFIRSIEAIKEMSRKHPKAVGKYIEDKANGTAIINSLRKEVNGLIPIQANDDKLARFRAVTPVIQAGNFYLPHPMLAPWVKQLIKEFLSFPNGKNDDWVDMVSQALNQLMYQTADTKKSEIPKGTWAYPILLDKGFTDMQIRKAYMDGHIKLLALPERFRNKWKR